MNYREIIRELKKQANSKNKEVMVRFGINYNNTLGVSVPVLRKMAKDIGKNHELALRLWDSGIHEARLVAIFIGEIDKVTEAQMDRWVKDIDSWDICDQACGNLFDKTPFAYKKVYEYVRRKEEFVRRVGFVLMATLSVHDKKAKNKDFERFFPLIKKYSTDERNFVKKAINWALRQIGKRNLVLNKKAVKIGKEILKKDSKSAKWIANNAIRELTSEQVQLRLNL